MEIEEVIKIYDFLGNLDLIGFVALCILLSISILAVFIPLKEKNIVSQKFIIIIACSVNVALIALYFQAQSKIPDLHVANFIKQDFITSNYKQKSFNRILLPDNIDDTAKKAKLLKDLIDKFPDEFLLVVLNDTAKNTLNRKGINLIDLKAVEKIDKQIKDRAITTARLLAYFMSTKKKDTVYIDSLHCVSNNNHPSLQRIDNTGWLIGQDFDKALIGLNNLQPIYYENYNIKAFVIPKP